jgi:hypothetical protein
MTKTPQRSTLARHATALGQSVAGFLADLDEAQQVVARIQRVPPQHQARIARQWLRTRQG